MIITCIEDMKPFSEFGYWFERITENVFRIINTTDGSIVGTFDENARGAENDILEAFDAYKETRPEYSVGLKVFNKDVTPEGVDIELEKEQYIKLLVGLRLKTAYDKGVSNPDDVIKGITSCIEWLVGTDFFTAPASTQYHEAFPGGLVHHTLKVYDELLSILMLPKFETVNKDDAILVALVHDWCKIGLYEKFMRNVKNEETGKWEQVPSYRHNQKGIPLGHGVTSMFIASKFFRLSNDQVAAIRWHMNAWNVAPNEMNDLQAANETYPLVHAIQFADQLAIVNY